MTNIELMMHHYEEALEELMDAQKYSKMAEHAESPDDKAMYRNLAKQELEHEAMIVKSGDRHFGEIHEGNLKEVWMHLKKHLHNWKSDIEHKMADA
mgnify:CR=1 FL=1